MASYRSSGGVAGPERYGKNAQIVALQRESGCQWANCCEFARGDHVIIEVLVDSHVLAEAELDASTFPLLRLDIHNLERPLLADDPGTAAEIGG